MEKKTASDLRTYLSTFEAKYPLQTGYLARLILNEKLTTANICKIIKDIVQTAEPDREICEKRLTTTVNKIKGNVVKKVNYSHQWTNLLKMYQKPFAIPLKSKESDSSAATSSTLKQLDLPTEPVILPDRLFSSAPVIQLDLSTEPVMPPDRLFSSAPVIQLDLPTEPVKPPDRLFSSAPVIQLDLLTEPVMPPDRLFSSAPVIQLDLLTEPVMPPDRLFSSAPVIQPDLAIAQQTSETPVKVELTTTDTPVIVELTSNSVNNHNESSFSVFSRSPSPKRLKRDCDNCVTKQRTNLNMLKENKSLRLQIRTLKQHHREERKQMSLKTLNEKIKRQSQAATLWRSKYTMLRRQFKNMEKVNRSIHRTYEKLLKKVHEEEHKKMTCRIEYLSHVLTETEMENACLRTELDKIKEVYLQNTD